VREHDDAAGYALVCVLAMGAASAYAWWRMLRTESAGLPPAWLRAVVTVLAALGLSVITRASYLGGKIVHESPKLQVAPSGSAVTPSAQVNTPP